MSLRADLADPDVNRPPCKIRSILESMSPDDKEFLESRLVNEGFQTQQIANALQANGMPASYSSVSRHRHGFCSCD